MADLDGRSRGQIILVAAFALAVIFITLALIVNSAIFTQNLASRGETAGGDDALSHRAMIEASVGDGIEIANRRNHSDDLRDAVNDSIDNITTQSERQQVTSGALVSVTKPTSITMGTRVVQNDSDNFNDTNDDSNWTVLSDVQNTSGHGGTRAFSMNVTNIPDDESSSFNVSANDTGTSEKWKMKIWGDIPSGKVVISVNSSILSRSTDCTVEINESFAVIDVTSGTINGKPCTALRWSSNDSRFARGAGSEYDIEFERTNNVEGNYSLIANRTGSTPTLNDPAVGSPYATEAIYNVTVGYTYETSDLRYNTTIRVAPGEPDV